MSENRRRRNNGAQNTQVKKARTNNARRILLLVGLMSLVAVISIGGTIAWLTDQTDAVTNTFTATDIEITLTETPNTDTNNDKVNDTWKAQLIPGKQYDKNPVVKVEAGTDVKIYLFVKKTSTADDYLTYTDNLNTNNEWNPVTGETGVWYRIVDVSDNNKEWHLIGDDKVTVKSSLTKETMAEADVTLEYVAYACQFEGFNDDTKSEAENALAAWNEVKPAPVTP